LGGEYVWERIFYIDNRGKNNTYDETRSFNRTITASYSSLTKLVAGASLKLGIKTKVGAAIEIFTAKVENSLDLALTTSYEHTIEQKLDTVESEIISRRFTVGANSIGEMYRLIYNGPGVTYATSMFSTTPLVNKKVIITCKVRKVAMLKDIQVVYTSQSIDMPDEVITDTDGGSPDINKGYKGKYVWLVPVWTYKIEEIVTSVHVVIQNEKNDKYQDLAAGTGGDYRYLKMIRSSTSSTAIKRVGLLMGTTNIYAERNKHGWDGCTEDINAGRQGGYLYVCWNIVTVQLFQSSLGDANTPSYK